MNIFRANDIRGIYGEELQDRDAYKIGNAFAIFTKSKTIVIGRDNRKSSPALHKHLIQGITDSGADVIDVGIIDSPGLYFASHLYQKPSIMITASHNPPEHNGFYLTKSNGECIFKENGLKEIENLVNTRKVLIREKRGKTKRINISKKYIEHVLSFLKISSIEPLKIVVDAGNGVGSINSKVVFDKLKKLKIIPLYFNLNGDFPNRGPDTTVEYNLHALKNKVKEKRADFGCAFDGDADRIVFVDNKGEIIEGSLTGALITEYILNKSNNKRKKIIYTIGCSKIVSEIIEENKGIAFKEKVGHSFVNARMIKEQAVFGIEHTGHYFYKDNFYTESPLITFLIICKILSSTKKSLSELIAPLKKYYMSKEISFKAKDRDKSFLRIKDALKKKYENIDEFDGLFVDSKDYWFRIRESQTEALIRMVIEGRDKSIVLSKEKEIGRLIQSCL